ncbi:alpha/beta hydrolase [Thermomonas brevis]
MTTSDPALQPENPSRRQLLEAGVLLGTAFAFGNGPAAAADTTTGRDNSMHTHTIERVQFSSGGETLVGLLCVPAGTRAARAAVVLLGPFGFVKEQSPAEYATRLADAGFVALIFDPRCSGESGGSPRRHEDPHNKIDDAKAAITWLAQRPEVDAARIGALGVCQGCSEMIAVAADEARVKALVLVSGQYLYAENLRKFFAGGGPTLEERIARGRTAKARYEAAGLVDYTDVVSVTDAAAGLPWRPIHDWYMPWTTQKWGVPSRWENRYTTMSDAEVWTFDVDPHARQLNKPTLIVHGEQSDGGPEAAQHVFDEMPAQDKRLHIVPGIFHTRFYDDPLVIEPTAALAVDWFARHLA